MFNKAYILALTKDILLTDSPVGYTDDVMKKIESYAADLGFHMDYTVKGNGVITLAGQDHVNGVIGVSAHVDTLGLMVRSIKADGTLRFTSLGAPNLATLDGEYCRVRTRDGKLFTGTILSTKPALHVWKDANTVARNEETMVVRLDEVVKSKDDVVKLGIGTGDFICIDTKTEMTETGFIKSRFLDDKLAVGILFGVMKYLRDNGLTPKRTVKILFSTYEEVGHGSSSIPADITELISIDMGCIGDDLSGTEYGVSICAKDTSGPYDFTLTNRMIDLARREKLEHAVDIYPFYGSDTTAALRGGNDIRGVLIGPGVAASHGMERSHYLAVENTMKLLVSYLM